MFTDKQEYHDLENNDNVSDNVSDNSNDECDVFEK